MKTIVPYVGAWLLAIGIAFALAVAAPNENSVMGRLPTVLSQTMARPPVPVPNGLPSERTLALITFQGGQTEQVESWIRGLNLKNDSSINWMRMAVRTDPGTQTGRIELETKLLKHFPDDAERARLVPVFTDPTNFVRSTGLNSTTQVSAVVVNREGDVLARAEGQFDESKAEALRETLKAQKF